MGESKTSSEIERSFLLRLDEERRREPPDEKTTGQCAECGRDIYRFEIECGYVGYDGSLLCENCFLKRQSQKMKTRGE